MKKITLLISESNNPVYPFLERWKKEKENIYDISLVTRSKDITQCGDILFLVSCSEIIHEATRALFLHTLVLHASDLPKGRGWSPAIWDVLEGGDKLTLSLLEASDPVDTGNLWRKISLPLNGSELFEEINDLLFKAELELIEWACLNQDSVRPKVQVDTDSSYRRKRNPEDSLLDIQNSLDSQFNLLRVSDPNRYPAFFYKNGQKYIIRIEKDEQ